MHLRFVLFLLFLSFFTGSASGQEAPKLAFTFGPELEEQKGNSINKTFGHSDEFFFCLRTDRRKKGRHVIEKIVTDSLTVVKTAEFIPAEVSGKSPVLAFPMSTADASFLIATADNPGGNEVYIMAYLITDDLKIAKEPVIIAIADRQALLAERGFLLFQSTDEKKVALFVPEEKDPARNEKFTLRYFDAEMNLLESKKIEIPYPSDKVLLVDAVMTPSGVFHGVISISEDSEVRVLPDSYALLSYNPKEVGVKEKALSLGNKWFYNIKLTITPDTNLWLAGYYSNMVEPSMVGTFSVVIESNTGKLLDMGLSPFERDFRLMFRKKIKSRENALSLFEMDKVYLKKSGLLSLVSEKRFERQSTIYEPATRMYRNVSIYYNEELLVSTIRPTSRIIANVVIPKYQSASMDFGRYSSYVSALWGENLLFFYNDHNRNEALSLTDYSNYRSLNNEHNINITYCILSNGAAVKQTINSEAADGYYLDAEQVYRAENCLILTTYKGYKTKYLKVLTP